MTPLPQVPRKHAHEIGVVLGGEHGERMADRPQSDPRDPLLKAKTKRGSDRPVQDCDRPRRSAKKDRLDQSAVDRRLEPVRM